MTSKSRNKGWGMTGKQRARIWCATVENIAPIIRALTALIVVLILIG